MSHHWLLITFSCFGPVSLQYINTGSLGAGPVLELPDANLHYPLPYNQYFSQQANLDTYQNDVQNSFNHEQESQRKRRTPNEQDQKTWMPNLVDTDKTVYFKNDEAVTPFIIRYNDDDDNNTEVEKKNFSPWGGKRDGPRATFEHMWSWKRSSGIREPSMPKRVRFSPWGGKRSGQMIYKPGSKGSKIIFSSSIPELTRIISNYSPNGKRLNLAGFQFIPGVDKRHPIKILALSTSMEERTLRDALPFNAFMEPFPKVFKPGHPYNEVHLKKDGKRKMKFSIWGGKRSPPIIGPIWTPASEDVQASTLNTILLLRNKQKDDETLDVKAQ